MTTATTRGAAGTMMTDFGPVSVSGAAVAKTDRGGTITLGGVAQQLMPANATRTGWSVYNSSAGDLWVNELGTASAGGSSIKIIPGALYEDPVNGVSTSAVSIYGATTGQSFAAREW